MTTAAEWVAGARPRTLGAAVSPVLVGTAAAYADADTLTWWRAAAALDMGLVNTVVPLEDLEVETVAWCRRMLQHSPLALRMLKASLNAADDGLAGIQQLAGDATLLYYMSEEAQEGKRAYLEKRRPEFEKFPKRP